MRMKPGFYGAFMMIQSEKSAQEFHMGLLRGRMGALADPKAPSDREAMASDKLDKTKAAPYEIIQQQKTNHDRSSTCAHFRGARCGNSARRDLRGGRRATDVSTLIAKEISHEETNISNNRPLRPVAHRLQDRDGSQTICI